MKILIAEDQVHLGDLLQQRVRGWGYEPSVVHDGIAAVEEMSRPAGPRLALLDWAMPGLDGIEVCRRVRQGPEGPYAYLVLVTGQGGREQMLEGLAAGADDFLPKPVDDAELRARLAAGRRVVELQEQLRHLATRDALTGLWNRAAILSRLEQELARGRREGHPVGVVLGDLDHFKRINDTYGHQAGDQALRQAGESMCHSLRSYDAVGRYGGEEFLIVLPGCDEAATLSLAERLRHSVAAAPIDLEGGPVPITLSVGVAFWSGGVIDTDALLRRADAGLYAAKRSGRNRVVVGEPAPPS
jgi:diguanylate cyclase (GGDEF)-like protein